MQKISITNFGPIVKAEVEIKDLVVFIGEQASGKSTISKLIYFFKSLKEDFFSLLLDTPNIEELHEKFEIEIIKKFDSFFGNLQNQNSFHIKYFYGNEKRNEKSIDLSFSSDDNISIKISNSFFYKATEKLLRSIETIKESKSNSKVNFFLHLVNAAKHDFSIINEIFEDEKTNAFLPAGRNITTTYSDQFKLDFFGNLVLENNLNANKNHSGDVILMLDFLRKIENIKETFKNRDFNALIALKLSLKNISKEYAQILHQAKNIIFEILKGKYQHDSNGEKIVFDSENSRSVSLNNASSGQQESIRILQDLFLILLNKESAFRVIEEPEAHLYPLAQKKLIELIGLVIQHTDSQILLTTHSPYILSVVNNLIFAKSVYNLQKAETGEHKSNLGIPEKSMIDPSNFQAYSIKNREKWEFVSIFDKKAQLIDQNYLDKISQIVAAEFDEMFEIYKELKPRKRQRKIN